MISEFAPLIESRKDFHEWINKEEEYSKIPKPNFLILPNDEIFIQIKDWIRQGICITQIQDLLNERLFFAVEEIADRTNYAKLYSEWLEDPTTQRLKGRNWIIEKVGKATEKNIQLMEESCQWLQDCLKRDDLQHQERNYLLFIYAKLGEKGIERLKQIMRCQLNYRESLTETQINRYLQKEKKYSVSCKRLINDGMCKNKECINYLE